ncbi:hypothetical protein COUCH_26225 [Couchioplanes caeruleus]|uniref:hypothetical protein n=1 Tax=Couchioplanes caeruleus TaxID=56438 RepID=UPI0020C1082D|nr:hypothetical protein [Couchioplanes caeruleus]UQU62518.1 hypothetical protein COUCH_26225 [Couchioplanes caeruleus]
MQAGVHRPSRRRTLCSGWCLTGASFRSPTLLFYGETDEWTPAEDSIAVWRRAAGTRDLTIRRRAGGTHLPSIGGLDTLDAISPDYSGPMLA